MTQKTPSDSVPSGSSYRPYYSYAPEMKPIENVSRNAAASAPVTPAAPAAPNAQAARPAPRPAPRAAQQPPAPPAKKSNKGFWTVAALVLILVVFVSAIYIAADGSSGSISSGNKVAVIHISGPMYTGELPYGSGYAGSDSIAAHIRAAVDNSSVKAIVLRIDSPGGTGSCSQEINAEIERAQSSGKPVVTSMGDQATSAAYYVASQTDYIYATPSTITGSIGVYTVHYDKSAAYDEAGIDVTMIKSGEMKDTGADFRPMTAAEEKYLQSVIDDMFRIFVKDVAEGRNMSYEEVLSLADGRYYTGNAAKENGLIDDFGNLYAATDKAAELAGLNSYTLYYPDNLTLSSLLF
ncbi:hypothetical protein MmiEs2_09750 [Methanimicrococcus stummii]|uniref:Peptidase S49 domain-containing protein n=1 Tax=Methanimicrococcus stummii TaxID=3028294 RepID=A0AA96VMA0_9EURY|nr:signal peptide peptidase SppA [Methanimicrococcus sp. Es2]WNY28772.1 hypothetical protein MmiEs2_09750 [Methanimicrococcus sp. Es2]